MPLMLSVIMINVVMLSVVAPLALLQHNLSMSKLIKVRKTLNVISGIEMLKNFKKKKL